MSLPIVMRFKVIDPKGREDCWAESPEQALGLLEQNYPDEVDRCCVECWEWRQGPLGRVTWDNYKKHCGLLGVDPMSYSEGISWATPEEVRALFR